MTDFDANDIMAGVITKIAEDSAEGFANAISTQYKRFKLALRADFQKYLINSLHKTSYVKTLINIDKPVPLDEIYVPLRFRSNFEQCTGDYLIDVLMKPRNIIISGTAGSGKSIFMKYVNNYIARLSSGALPVYFELRNLNDTNIGLMDALYKEVSVFIKSIDRTSFMELAAQGKLIFILDGFDEIEHDKRFAFSQEIHRLSSQYPNMSMLISTRPEDQISSLSWFWVFHAEGMNMEECVELTSKLGYDREKRDAFSEGIRHNLYDKYKEFLSNPLLTTMMLMTYSLRSDIPETLAVFYQQAFEVLFERHDRSKGVFTRKSHSALRLDQFQRVFAHFCALTYSKQKFFFTASEMHDYLSNAIYYDGEKVDSALLLNDLIESTCLMQRDGLTYSFVHRSFQEFFTAWFISRLPSDQYVQAIDGVLGRATSDNVLPLLSQISRDRFEASWALPTLKEIKKLFGTGTPKEVMRVLYKYLVFTQISVGMLADELPTTGLKYRVLRLIYEGWWPGTAGGKDWIGAIKRTIERDERIRARLSRLLGEDSLSAWLKGEIQNDYRVRLTEVDDDILKALDLADWSKGFVDWIDGILLTVEERVISKSKSLAEMFSTSSLGVSRSDSR